MNRAFFDSNVLIYSVDADLAKRSRAQAVLDVGGAISIQCLTEFATVARRKLRLSWEAIDTARDQFLILCDPVLPITLDVHRTGLAIAELHRLSIYESMIVAAALATNCDTLYSEDMHDGLVIDGRLKIVNPFALP